MNTRRITFLIFCIALLFASCKKDSGLDPLSNVVFPKNGVIRVECADCALTYTILKDNFAVDVKNSEDVKFSYVSDFELKTSINSKKKQNIRLAVFDSYGRMVSNELSSIEQGVSKIDSFNIKVN
ncbi:hypothetical protein [Pedobacter sp. MR2016-24]|uniref:hypothetical protein n=1 Tax=Pedobacter sp. MR2016-24 TaxID=2994466 RepID=UPI002247EB86|nr:hypothetical protein [Pedobacter sp. MR2016-24]MCX2486459.1 hypothetical protein [Pedobacter sp. MR2016-24]